MKISAINSINQNVQYKANSVSNSKVNFEGKAPNKTDETKTYTGEAGQQLIVKDKNNLFEIENISNKKIGSKFLLRPTDPEFSDLTILFKPDSTLKSEDGNVKMAIADSISFTGKVYGSIRRNDDGTEDEKMKKAYSDFWTQGMYSEITTNYINKHASKIRDDYNFFIPSDGDGTRYRDITLLQGGVTKPASQIPATLNGKNMRLVQGVLTNFAKTGKLDEGHDFVVVEPARGSAYAFLEGLANGTIPTDKPVVFSWGDNFSDIDITRLILEHEKTNAGMTILTLPVTSERIQALGAVKVKGQNNLEMTDFYEKPKEPELIKSFIIPGTEDKCLGAVGPYVIAPEALQWLKEHRINNPEMFKDHEGNFDFSRRIIGNLLPAMANGEIKDKNGEPLRMMAYEKPSSDTWSDLGSEKDFSAEMKNVKNGQFSNLPQEMRDSISKNVDEVGNITFDVKTKAKLARFTEKYGIDLKNTVVYSK